MPPYARPCVADRLGRRLGIIRGTSRSARRNESVADGHGPRGARLWRFVSSRIVSEHTFFYKHSIATSRCRKTEWLLCGAHASSVLDARFALVLDGKAAEFVAAYRTLTPRIRVAEEKPNRSSLFPLALYAVAKVKTTRALKTHAIDKNLSSTSKAIGIVDLASG